MFRYGLCTEFVDEPTPEDIVFEDKGVKVVVDGKSLQFLDGTQLDFVKEGLNEGFKFTNPNVKDEWVAAKASTFDAHTDNPTVSPARGFVLPDSPLSRRIAALRMLWITSPSLACLPVINSIPCAEPAFSGSTTSVSS